MMMNFKEFAYLKEQNRLDRRTLSDIVEDEYEDVKEVARNLSQEQHEKLRLAVEEYKRAKEVAKRYYSKAKKGEAINED